MAGIKDYWTVKGIYLAVSCDPTFEMDVDWVQNYISRTTEFGKSPQWLELSTIQQQAICRRMTLREFVSDDTQEMETFKLQVPCGNKDGEMYILLSGTCELVSTLSRHSLD